MLLFFDNNVYSYTVAFQEFMMLSILLSHWDMMYGLLKVFLNSIHIGRMARPKRWKLIRWGSIIWYINHAFFSVSFSFLFQRFMCIRVFILSFQEFINYLLYSLFQLRPPRDAPPSWYTTVALEKMKVHGAIYLTPFSHRLAEEIDNPEYQRLRCRVNYHALRFKPHIKKLSDSIVSRLRTQGHFMAIHLRFEMDMLAFAG